ncbi:head-tail connector protein, partial [Novosphingobium album (ex Liu et al. 2023)]
ARTTRRPSEPSEGRPPAGPPAPGAHMAGFISLADAKAQMRVDSSDEDATIQRLIDAASRHVERLSGYVAGQRSETFRFDVFGRQLELRLRPVDLESIEIRYLDASGAEQTFTDFRATEKHGTVRLVPAIGACWPSAACAVGAISVSAQVGFALDEDGAAPDTPDHVLHAVRICVASWFLDREEGPVPQTVIDLLDDDRARRV